MELTGDQFEQLQEAVINAFPQSELDQMVRIELSQRLSTIVAGSNDTDRVFNLIEWAESNNKVIDLIRGACRRNPSNDNLRTFCQTYRKILLQEACQDSNSQLSSGIITNLIGYIAELINLPPSIITLEQWREVGLRALPVGVEDDPSDKDLADFKNGDLNLTLRLFGFLKLAVGQFPRKGQQPTLVLFAQELLEIVPEDIALQSGLDQWLQQAQPTVRSSPGAVSNANKQGTLETSLMITVRPCVHQKPTEQEQYLVEGWLYFDQISGLREPRRSPYPLTRLSLPEAPDKLGIRCTWLELRERVDDFLQEARKQLSSSIQAELRYRRYILTLEMFLPVGYMAEPIDQWPRVSRSTTRLGEEYGVIVRFCDRIDDDERQNQIFGEWDRLTSLLDSSEGPPALLPDEHIEEPETLATYPSWKELERKLKKKLGLKLCCGLPNLQDDQKGLFEAMLYGDIPIAAWVRNPNIVVYDSDPPQPLELSQALMTYFDRDCCQHPTQLATRLRVQRQSYHGEESDERYGRCLGDQIAFLLDNPDRLPLPDQLGS